jgi:hypothetical protein
MVPETYFMIEITAPHMNTRRRRLRCPYNGDEIVSGELPFPNSLLKRLNSVQNKTAAPAVGLGVETVGISAHSSKTEVLS